MDDRRFLGKRIDQSIAMQDLKDEKRVKVMPSCLIPECEYKRRIRHLEKQLSSALEENVNLLEMVNAFQKKAKKEMSTKDMEKVMEKVGEGIEIRGLNEQLENKEKELQTQELTIKELQRSIEHLEDERSNYLTESEANRKHKDTLREIKKNQVILQKQKDDISRDQRELLAFQEQFLMISSEIKELMRQRESIVLDVEDSRKSHYAIIERVAKLREELGSLGGADLTESVNKNLETLDKKLAKKKPEKKKSGFVKRLFEDGGK